MRWPAWRRAPLAAAAILLLLSCGDDEPLGPAPAAFDVVVSPAAGSIGAVLFFVEGGPVDSVESVGYYTASAPYSGVTTQVLVAGAELAGAVARIRVPDGRVSYRAVPREAAERSTHRLLTIPDSLLTLVPVRR